MFAQDVDAKDSGLWEEIYGMRFKIAHINNPRWKDEHAKQMQLIYKGAQKKTKFEGVPEKDMKVMIKTLALTCITDWEGVSTDEGEPAIPFSLENSVKILTDKKYEPLALKLIDLAASQDRFMETQIEADEEALGESSGGSTDTVAQD